MHLLSAILFTGIIYQVSGLETVIGIYGETLEVPCNNGAAKPKELLFTTWKYDKGVRPLSDLIVKVSNNNETRVTATDEYKDRVSMAENFSLLISAATLGDQKTFTCMDVVGSTIAQYPVNVLIHKAPSALELSEKAEELEIGKLTKIGQCTARAANPAANITWYKNKEPLTADGKGIVIDASVEVDPLTGLSTTASTLKYSADKGDMDALFSCGTRTTAGQEQLSSPVTFTIRYPTEHISLRVVSEGPVMEGDNVTLQCLADGNPAPTSFHFHIKGEMKNVVDSDTYTMTGVTREDTGEYRCSLTENPTLEASTNITVSYLNINLSPSDDVVKRVGESLAVTLQVDASGDHMESWTKDNIKMDKQPDFNNLTFADSGHYECEVTMGLLSQKADFELTVEGVPVIRQLTKVRGEDGQHKMLICEAEGSPKPSVSWSINGTSLVESPFVNGKITHTITVEPTVNLTVVCTVYNEHGQDSRPINVSSLFVEVRMDKQDQPEDGDQTKMVVGIVAGVLIAALVIGVAYWMYMKKSKQGSWKTGEIENGSSEEEKKLEEKEEENSQKAAA